MTTDVLTELLSDDLDINEELDDTTETPTVDPVITAAAQAKADIAAAHENVKNTFQNMHGSGKFATAFLATQWTYMGKATDKANAPLKAKGMMTLGAFAKLVDVTPDTITNYRNTYELAVNSDEYPNAVMPTDVTDPIPDFSDDIYKGKAWTDLNKLYRQSKLAEKKASDNPFAGTPFAFLYPAHVKLSELEGKLVDPETGQAALGKIDKDSASGLLEDVKIQIESLLDLLNN